VRRTVRAVFRSGKCDLLLRRLRLVSRRRRRSGSTLSRGLSSVAGRLGGLPSLLRSLTSGISGLSSSLARLLSGVSGRSSRRRRSCSLVRARRFLLRAGREHQRGNDCAKSKFCIHRSVPRREARVVLIGLLPVAVVPHPLAARDANSIELPVRLETEVVLEPLSSPQASLSVRCDNLNFDTFGVGHVTYGIGSGPAVQSR
jgi:hypothetical protein